ncbi:adenine nucleotide alpha hydrolases-like protein [Xylariaceae sp. AK1471]|nr:adenine nucleotide alpha hydrolases-like protein [Xylariaceae sp. AK1471]
MGTLSQVLHTGARPISTHEFAEVLRATCPPRFPAVSTNTRRIVGLAVSGGVDSMALAYLCTRIRSYHPDFRVSDNPVAGFRGIVVDHGMREGSRREANAVCMALRGMGLMSEAYTISWSKVLGQYKHPKELPNFESVARRLRYQKLGQTCSYRKIASLLLAHHQDDQYETVLMRLLQGHGVRGLRGMRTASDIPECEGLHGAHQSGYVDDQRQSTPYYNNNVSRQQWRKLKSELRSNINHLMHEEELRNTGLDGLDDYDFEDLYQSSRVVPLEVSNVDVEDGGVMIYRPLLEFSKDRLIATCEANKIPWWEDHTNQDQTLTMRNAVRHMYKNYALPVALQKSSILALSRRCEQKAQALEVEANRLLAQTIIHDVEPNVGSASVQFPEYGLSQSPRDMSSPSRRRARILRQREVAGLLIKRIILLVSPDAQAVPLANLQNFISRLFPALSTGPNEEGTEPPKAFVIAGIHFVPIEPHSNKGTLSRRAGEAGLIWYLSRTPYPSNLPVPRYRTPYWSSKRSWRDSGRGFHGSENKWSRWTRWGLWDGRYWVRMKHRLPYRVILQPFIKEHTKAFREQLAPDDRDRLAVLLKRYAPGKTRYTLPALYFEEDLDLNHVEPRPYYPLPPSVLQHVATAKRSSDPNSDHPRVLDVSKMKLVALPSLDIQIPKLEDWLEYEIRYRRIDRATLHTAGSFHRGSFMSPRLLKALSAPRPRRRRRRRRRRLLCESLGGR